ncbi:hypothetical protein QBC32DRAFT_342669 [Pseudoneurospora amorphoporcata]|uniref:Uncharacterized protein n=1 Tax=Pseudoneurospora amorphoporcata TaxID=241081 RepID=A0AAN6NUA0_9PEZI|nr:hypothetical protein QBC32DRAFT_342669 [Pseudoneurospora amorphoporcata]
MCVLNSSRRLQISTTPTRIGFMFLSLPQKATAKPAQLGQQVVSTFRTCPGSHSIFIGIICGSVFLSTEVDENSTTLAEQDQELFVRMSCWRGPMHDGLYSLFLRHASVVQVASSQFPTFHLVSPVLARLRNRPSCDPGDEVCTCVYQGTSRKPLRSHEAINYANASSPVVGGCFIPIRLPCLPCHAMQDGLFHGLPRWRKAYDLSSVGSVHLLERCWESMALHRAKFSQQNRRAWGEWNVLRRD